MRRREERPRGNKLSGLKIKVPPFDGRNNSETYLEWETKMERIFVVTPVLTLKRCRLKPLNLHNMF